MRARRCSRRAAAASVAQRRDRASRRSAPSSEIDCDLLVVSGGTVPATSLLLQAGAKARYDERAGTSCSPRCPDGVLRRRRGRRQGRPRLRRCSGAIAGAEAAQALGSATRRPRPRSTASARASPDARPAPVAVPPPATSDRKGKCFACLCEDVTVKDIQLSIDEGYDSIELSKRYTTVTMGPCQGRMCQLPSIRVMAQETGSRWARSAPRRRARRGRGADGRARRAADRAGQALGDPRPPPRARRATSVGGRLAPRLRLRRPAGRGAGGAQGGRADRRLDARQADRPRARTRASSSTACTRTASRTSSRAASATA